MYNIILIKKQVSIIWFRDDIENNFYWYIDQWDPAHLGKCHSNKMFVTVFRSMNKLSNKFACPISLENVNVSV